MEGEQEGRHRSSPDSNRIIQGLWVGPELSVMEQLSIASFLQNGHEYHLYVYDDIKNIPTGAVVKDANQILPASRIFQYKHHATYAGFSNFFRYKLLLERGGWWVDTDTICLRWFDFPEEHVFSSERVDELEVINSGIIKAPAGSQVMAYAWQVCQSKNPQELVWGETGPRLMGEAVKKSSMEQYKKPYHVFCPLSYSEWHRVLQPETRMVLDAGTYGVHLWNEMWRANGQDKSAQYPEGCLYEQLKRRYLVTGQSQLSVVRSVKQA
jgi:mannosyltransferase OCH1-like enzyme